MYGSILFTDSIPLFQFHSLIILSSHFWRLTPMELLSLAYEFLRIYEKPLRPRTWRKETSDHKDTWQNDELEGWYTLFYQSPSQPLLLASIFYEVPFHQEPRENNRCHKQSPACPEKVKSTKSPGVQSQDSINLIDH